MTPAPRGRHETIFPIFNFFLLFQHIKDTAKPLPFQPALPYAAQYCIVCIANSRESFMDSKPSSSQSPSPTRTPSNSQALAGLRVLLVDDSRTNQIIIGTLLAKAGILVCCADDGPMALELLERGPCDIVLTDLLLPEMDGFEISRRIRQNPRLAGLPIIALSGYTEDEQREAIAQAGINAFLTKPASLEDLLATLAAWSRKTPSEDRITPAAPEAAPDTDPAPRP